MLRLIKGENCPSHVLLSATFSPFFCYQCEEKKQIDDLITNGIEEGMEVRCSSFSFSSWAVGTLPLVCDQLALSSQQLIYVTDSESLHPLASGC